MAVPSSGQLREYADIGVELGVAQSNVSLRGMSNTAGFSSPDAMSEFYGYSAATIFDDLDPFNDNSQLALLKLDNNFVNSETGNTQTSSNVSYVTGLKTLSNEAIKGSVNSKTNITDLPNRQLQRTVMFWFKKDNITEDEKELHWDRDGLHTKIGFYNNLLKAATFNGSTEFFTNGIAVNANQWYHFALVANGNTHSLYLNGANYQDYSQGENNTGDAGAQTSLYMYDAFWQSGNASTAAVDSYRYFNRNLTATEVNTIYVGERDA